MHMAGYYLVEAVDDSYERFVKIAALDAECA